MNLSRPVRHILLLFTVTCGAARAQSLDRSVTAAGGRTALAGNVCLQYTVGEAVISPATTPTALLSGGFQRPSGYDFWVAALGVTGGPGGDPDGDGLPNLMEYAAGSNPLLASSARRPEVSIGPGGKVYITLAKGPGAGEVTWTAEASSDLTTWSDENITVALNDATTFSALYTGSPGRIYLRLRVSTTGSK